MFLKTGPGFDAFANQKAIELIRNFTPVATTTSATFVVLQAAPVFTFSGGPVLLQLLTSSYSTAVNTASEFAIQIDAGADVVIGNFFHSNANEHNTSAGFLFITPAAGSRTITIRWRRPAGAGTLTYDNNDYISLAGIQF